MTDRVVPDDPAGEQSDGPGGVVFWLSMATGGAIVLWGAAHLVEAMGGGLASFDPRLALDDVDTFLFGDRLRSVVIWFAGAALLADLVIVPAGGAVAALVRRLLPTWAWRPVRAALLSSAVLVLLAVPTVLGLVDPVANPTVRPRDTTAGLLAALGVTWALTLLVLVAARGLSSRRRLVRRRTEP